MKYVLLRLVLKMPFRYLWFHIHSVQVVQLYLFSLTALTLAVRLWQLASIQTKSRKHYYNDDIPRSDIRDVVYSSTRSTSRDNVWMYVV